MIFRWLLNFCACGLAFLCTHGHGFNRSVNFFGAWDLPSTSSCFGPYHTISPTTRPNKIILPQDHFQWVGEPPSTAQWKSLNSESSPDVLRELSILPQGLRAEIATWKNLCEHHEEPPDANVLYHSKMQQRISPARAEDWTLIGKSHIDVNPREVGQIEIIHENKIFVSPIIIGAKSNILTAQFDTALEGLFNQIRLETQSGLGGIKRVIMTHTHPLYEFFIRNEDGSTLGRLTFFLSSADIDKVVNKFSPQFTCLVTERAIVPNGYVYSTVAHRGRRLRIQE